ncbi:putative inactive receptor kinase At4g23740 [Nicotiana tabacum]|uniref:Inactive receptor kinase At4g23740 n=1 Tax=Nicotiana tabacum TaxID=4097 RepID=A0A1S3Z3B6_TOBAC|nr:probably inactive receptor-like protein kinase At5g41680 [Nicotiana tomentosiformis]XP_016458919.1 PREDICTED: probably inactive receptor-like protein kinase At5g41680 [Nicotiana tabacum]
MDNLLKLILSVLASLLFIRFCNGGELIESKSFLNFILAIDPNNVLGIKWNSSVTYNPCSYKLQGVKCNLRTGKVTEIRLENMNLNGVIDAEPLCKLSKLRVLSLARNKIRGTIPESISMCKSLTVLDLSTNFLSGNSSLLLQSLTMLKNLKKLNVSNNNITFSQPSTSLQALRGVTIKESTYMFIAPSSTRESEKTKPKHHINLMVWLLIFAAIVLVLVLLVFLYTRCVRSAKDKEVLKEVANYSSPRKTPSAEVVNGVCNTEEKSSELFFFMEDVEKFTMDDLLEATANLRKQGLCSSLYKVHISSSGVFAVKRLKKLQVGFKEFSQTMRKIGNLKHQNVLPLVAYYSSNEEKFLIYKYQNNGSLLTLFEDYVEGKRNFPWKLRLSVAVGIARGLAFIYRSSKKGNAIPHGNIKPSNILLDENEEPLISEYGYCKFLDPNKSALYNDNGYTAPEKNLTEEADAYSFGVILLELLTGKIVEKTGLDLVKWVKSIVREEWTGEVFDSEVANFEMYAFPLLNVALKCVERLPEERPTVTEVLEIIEEVVNDQEDISPSSMTSFESTPGSMKHL